MEECHLEDRKLEEKLLLTTQMKPGLFNKYRLSPHYSVGIGVGTRGTVLGAELKKSQPVPAAWEQDDNLDFSVSLTHTKTLLPQGLDTCYPFP